MRQTNSEYKDEKTTDTQCARVLSHMRSGRSITAAEAYERYGILRLAARISDIQNGKPLKYRLRDDEVLKSERAEKGKNYKKYWIESKPVTWRH